MQIIVLVNKMVVLPSNTVLVFMILVLLSVPSLNQSEKDEMSPICDDKTHFENGHRISFSSHNNSSNNFSNGNFRITDRQIENFFDTKRKRKNIWGLKNGRYK